MKSLLLTLVLVFSFGMSVLPVSAQTSPDSVARLPSKHGGVVPDCNPVLPPNTPYSPDETDPEKIPCGINKFVELLQKLIEYLSLAVIPIAVLMVGWGGFQILTSAGSEEKLGAGRQAIITAATGIVIILVSYLVIKLVFDALGVDPSFRGSLFD